MPYSQERPMRHIFLVEVSSWSENQIRWTKQRHLVMLEMGLFFHGSDGLNERDENKNCNKSCCMVFGTWIERQRSRCETNVKCTHDQYETSHQDSHFLGLCFGGSAEVEKEWLVTLATINPSEVEYEDPLGLVTLVAICSGFAASEITRVAEDFVPCARRLAKQLKEPFWKMWRHFNRLGWGQGLCVNFWHLSQSPTNPELILFRNISKESASYQMIRNQSLKITLDLRNQSHPKLR